MIEKKILKVSVQPKSSRQQLVQISETEFKAKLFSAPTKGKANAELLELLAEHLKIPHSKLRLIRGETSRIKFIEILE
ncbi:MAG: DUF167 domain-containing protein [Candidatus Saccharicenans sp.]